MRTILELRTVTGRGGGPEKTILHGPRFLADHYRVLVTYLRPEHDPEYDLPERARALGVEFVDVPERGPADPRTMVRLARLFRRERPCLIHAHDYKTNLLAVLLGRVFGVPVISTVHGYAPRGGRLELYYSLDRWTLRLMAHVVAVSDDLARLLTDQGLPGSRLTLLENGIDTGRYVRRQLAGEARRAFGVRCGRMVVGAVGRLSPEKGFDLLIRAADRLLRHGLDIELHIAGEGPERGRLEALVRELGIADRVRLHGHVADPVPLFEALDVFALSSLREGLPNVVLEAMALEAPVVATRIAGVPRLVRDGETGLLVSPGSIDELADGIARVLADVELAGRLAAAGRREVEERYSFAARMTKLREIYDELLDRPADVPRLDGVDAPSVSVG